MLPSYPALRLTVFVGEHDFSGRKSAHHEIVTRALNAGLSGASVFRGVAGFGASGTLRTTRILSMSGTMPLMVVIVDSEERIRNFLPQLVEVVPESLVMLDEVEVVQRAGSEERR